MNVLFGIFSVWHLRKYFVIDPYKSVLKGWLWLWWYVTLGNMAFIDFVNCLFLKEGIVFETIVFSYQTQRLGGTCSDNEVRSFWWPWQCRGLSALSSGEAAVSEVDEMQKCSNSGYPYSSVALLFHVRVVCVYDLFLGLLNLFEFFHSWEPSRTYAPVWQSQ
jgi:hypothetical protein